MSTFHAYVDAAHFHEALGKETMMLRYSVDNGTRTHIATKFAFKAWNEMGEYE